MENSIELTDVVQQFGPKEALKGVTLQVKSGEIFGLLGPSGAGKTTIIKIMTGQLHPTKGQAVTNGMPSDKMTGKTYRRIGMMMDVPGLYERLSCYDNLKLFARLYAVPEKRIREALEKVGLSEAAKRPVEKLSKGMKGRLALARAVMNEPQILFLDEPTSGLDPVATRRIHELILEEQAKGTTVFLTTHNMLDADLLCDRVAFITNGEITALDTPKSLKEQNSRRRVKIDYLYRGRREEGVTEIAELEKGISFPYDEILSIHSEEPTLEDMFVQYTGRGLS